MQQTCHPFKITKDGVTIFVKITSNSKNNQILGLYLENHLSYLKIAIKTQAIENKANYKLINFLAKLLKLNKSLFIIKQGLKSTKKSIFISTSSPEYLSNLLLNLITTDV